MRRQRQSPRWLGGAVAAARPPGVSGVRCDSGLGRHGPLVAVRRQQQHRSVLQTGLETQPLIGRAPRPSGCAISSRRARFEMDAHWAPGCLHPTLSPSPSGTWQAGGGWVNLVPSAIALGILYPDPLSLGRHKSRAAAAAGCDDAGAAAANATAAAGAARHGPGGAAVA